MAGQHTQTHLRAIANQDGAAILDTKAGRITTLNSTGAFVWQSLKSGEGIETISQLEQLKLLSCDQVQGFLLATPLPPDDLERFLQKQRGSLLSWQDVS